MPNDYIDDAIAAFAASQGSDEDGLTPEARAEAYAIRQAEKAANQKMELAELVKSKIEAGVRIINERARGKGIPRIAVCGTNYTPEAGISVPTSHDIQFADNNGVPVKYQPLGYIAFRFDVDADVKAITLGAGPHHPDNIPAEFVFGTMQTVSMTGEWVANMIARWLARENLR